jgi:hypothetical protein
MVIGYNAEDCKLFGRKEWKCFDIPCFFIYTYIVAFETNLSSSLFSFFFFLIINNACLEGNSWIHASNLLNFTIVNYVALDLIPRKENHNGYSFSKWQPLLANVNFLLILIH